MTDPILPRVYCAAPWPRHAMWETLHDQLFAGRINVVSRWHRPEGQALDDTDPADCFAGWQRNLHDIKRADHVLAYAEYKDHPNGTLFEIGYAHSIGIPVWLVGNFAWGTWRHLPLMNHRPTLREAVQSIVHLHPPTTEFLR